MINSSNKWETMIFMIMDTFLPKYTTGIFIFMFLRAFKLLCYFEAFKASSIDFEYVGSHTAEGERVVLCNGDISIPPTYACDL